MLSTEDKKRIREEEIFRFEVRRSLAQKKPHQSRLWAFFNTPFGVWFLSTIAVGFFGWSYAQFEVSRQHGDRIDRIDDEILARLETVKDYSAHLAFVPNDSSFNIADILLDPPNAERAIDPDFANRNFLSLLYELRGLVTGDENAFSEILKALVEIRVIESEYLHKKLAPDEHSQFMSRIETLQDIRWTGAKWIRRHHQPYEKPLGWLFAISISMTTLYLFYDFCRWAFRKVQRSTSL